MTDDEKMQEVEKLRQYISDKVKNNSRVIKATKERPLHEGGMLHNAIKDTLADALAVADEVDFWGRLQRGELPMPEFKELDPDFINVTVVRIGY